MTRRVWLIVTAAATLIIGVDRSGLLPIASGPHLDLESSSIQHGTRTELILATDAGDVTGWVRLGIASRRALGEGALAASLSNGAQLAVRQAPASTGSSAFWEIGLPPEETTRGVRHFVWPAGSTLRVLVSDASARLTDWTVFTAEQGSDSRSKSIRRRIWHWAFMSLIALSVAGAVLATGGEPAAPINAHRCATAIIASLSAEKNVKTFLTRVLIERWSAEEALQSLKIRGRDRATFVFKAHGLFKSRMQNLIDDLNAVVLRLG